MPATPEPTPTTMSPADLLRHHPTASALQFLSALYPEMPNPPPHELGVAQDASIELVCGVGWTGALLVAGTTQRTLHVLLPATLRDGPLRDDVLALLDYACERLRARRVVLALQRKEMRDFGAVLHGLCYVGAVVVANGGHAMLSPKEGVVLAAIDL